tara:strand:+ start:1565 stop:4351 length:2787 start_codon:yes stop_codon:yes gene_type:complete
MADYGINIGVNVQSGSLTKLSQQLKELRAIEKDLIDIQKSGSLSQKKLTSARRAAKDEINANKKAALDSAKAFTQNTGILQKGIGALKEQEAQLRAYRRSTKNAKEGWTTFTQAIVKTNFSGAFSQLKAFNKEAQATANTFKLMSMSGGGPAFARGSSLQDLLSFKPANTTNALRAYSDTLEGIIVQVDRGTKEYRELFAAIKRVNQELSKVPAVATFDQYQAPIGPDPARTGFGASARRGARNIAGSPIARQLRNRRVKDALGGGLIGGAFPAVMGQSMQSAALGGIGGLAGGAIGGQMGFALSILGTALGEAIEKQIQFNKALKELNVTFGRAGSDTKLFAGDIDNLAKSLKITKEEALELAGAFAFLGDPKLATNAAKLFGSKRKFDIIAGIKDEATFSRAILSLTEDASIEQAKQLFLSTRNLEIDERRKKVSEALNKFKKQDVKLTTEEARASGFAGRRAARRSTKIVESRTPVTAQEARDITDPMAELLKLLEVTKPETARASGMDPTIDLQRRLEIVIGQINSEEDLLELQGKQSELSRIILRQEKAINKAKATGVAERKKLVDEEDKVLSRAIEAGSIKAANLKFSRESLDLADKTLKKTENLAKPLQDQIDAIKDKAAFEREYGDLIRAGVIPAVAQQTVEINKQVKEIDRLLEKQLEEMDLGIKLLQLQVDQAAGTELEVELQEKLNEALRRRNEIESKGEQAKGAAKDAQKTDKDRIEDTIEAIQGQINTLMDPVNQLIALSDSLGNSFAESFRGIIDGSMTAREALANLFQRTADHFLDMAAQMIAAQIKMQILNIGLSFFGGGNPGRALNLAGVSEYSNVNANTRVMGFADGGRPPVGRPSLVGERGPELFVPGASGTIIPNHAMGGANVTVNVDASGSSVEGDSDQASQLGKMLGAAVQAELIKQKRPGGLLSS